MGGGQISNEFLFDKAQEFTEVYGVKVTIEQVISSFDAMKYFRLKGNVYYPVVTMLARIHFFRLDNAGFQERLCFPQHL